MMKTRNNERHGIDMNYISGKVIRELREKKQITQKQLADCLRVSDKTISKWETERGLPDISIIGDLAETLGVSVAEIMMGEYTVNENRCANIRKSNFYVCPVCGNVIWSIGKGTYSCCGIMLPALEVEEQDEKHELDIKIIDNQYAICLDHPMTKEHYISFAAYVTVDSCEVKKMYPEQNMECSFTRKGGGDFYLYCNRHGLFRFSNKVTK